MISTDHAQTLPHTSTEMHPWIQCNFSHIQVGCKPYGFHPVFQNPVKNLNLGRSRTQLTFQGAAEELLWTNDVGLRKYGVLLRPAHGAGDRTSRCPRTGLGQAHSLTREAPDQQLSTRPRVDALLTPAPSTVPAGLSLAQPVHCQLGPFCLPPQPATYSTDGDWPNLMFAYRRTW